MLNSLTITCNIARATMPSVPGTIGTHSSALLAALLHTGSNTTSFMPRARALAPSDDAYCWKPPLPEFVPKTIS